MVRVALGFCVRGEHLAKVNARHRSKPAEYSEKLLLLFSILQVFTAFLSCQGKISASGEELKSVSASQITKLRSSVPRSSETTFPSSSDAGMMRGRV